MENVIVIKQNTAGEETWRYPAKVLRKTPNGLLLEAFFNRPDYLFNGLCLKHGDRFIELYFDNRWYNIFEIHDVENDALKGWYCNVAKPARFSTGEVSYIDLALDLLVFPDGRSMVLDEDEFDTLELDRDTRSLAYQALTDLQSIMASPGDFNLENWIQEQFF